MIEKLKKHHISFKNAFAGLFYALKTQPNFQIHVTLSVIALIMGLFLRITNIEMVLIITMIIMGLVVEMLNTSIESITDLITTEWKMEAKIAKDVAAGMMLLMAFGACIIAGVIFIPYLRHFLIG